MSKFTTELRYICETLAESSEYGYSSVNQTIANSRGKLFDFTYPIFDEDYRIPLETKIIKHFYTREIGFETYGLFKLKLDTKMNEIMPYYNKMYESALIEFDPIADVDYEKTTGLEKSTDDDGTRSKTGTVENSVDSTITDTGTISDRGGNTRTTDMNENTHSVDKYSDTPQGAVTGLESGNYLTNATIDDIDVDKSGTVVDDNNNTKTLNTQKVNTEDGVRTYDTVDTHSKTIETTEDYVEKCKGRRGFNSPNKMLREFRQNIINIDMMVIAELSTLFFGLWE